ncbi:unnamed protein product [Clonostachys byssicola]|uniref:F-box domain-containing protein n=1 Tax=Clonostachys byssicola TaxID=160290 RepID=A0A9N9Y206_9HYPO|nr:unnamed protein product [Clonostachys byssicola]
MTPDSTTINLQDLPPETLDQIASYLTSHQPSLYAFSLASRACHCIASKLIFHQINITVSNPVALKRDIDGVVDALSRTESARHVNCLSFKGSLCLNDGRNAESKKEAAYSRDAIDSVTRWFKATGTSEILTQEEPVPSGAYVIYDEPVIQKASDEDMAWAPVVGLIELLPRLAKLLYDCQNQFPPSLLDALHEHQPGCKLYHMTFRLRTLFWDTPYPYEMALATSPCLYGVRLACTDRDTDGDDDFNQAAMMDLVSGLAPNLREVTIVNFRAYMPSRFFRQPEPWHGLPGFIPGSSVGSLTSLSLIGSVHGFLSGDLQSWAKSTDFRCLHHLALGGGFGAESAGISGEMMEWISQNCSFPQLKTLIVRLSRCDTDVQKPDYSRQAIEFLGAIRPLAELSVSGPLDPRILDAILSGHGQTVKSLDLRPDENPFQVDNRWFRRQIPMIFSKQDILQIQAQCPVLEKLAITVKRTKSDAIEADIYRTFSKFNRLRSLFLTLDCSNWRVVRDPTYQPAFDEEDNRPCEVLGEWLKEGHLREAFMNCAVDERLARSIWEIICQDKMGRKLECLKIWTTGGGKFGNTTSGGNIGDIVENLSRSWLLERVPRHNENIISIRELGLKAREARDKEGRELDERRDAYLLENGIEPTPRDCHPMRAFRRVWPCKPDSKDWRLEWSSLPLQIGESCV